MAMVQAVSYNFSTVENPLSDGGNFSEISDTNITGALKVIAGNLCEIVTVNAAGGASWQGAINAPGGTWPNDQYSEITLTTWGTGASCDLICRQGSPTSGTQYFAGLVGSGGNTYTFYAVVSGTVHVLVTGSQASAATDVFRFSVVGNVLTLFRNGSQVQQFTDTNNYVTSGQPGFSLGNSSAIAGTQTALFAAGANQSATPTFNPAAGTYTGTQTVTITSATGGTIYYTTDGTTPTHSSSSIASGSTISVSSSKTVKAIASVANNLDSATGSAAYTINPSSNTSGSFVQSFRDFVNKRGNDDTPPKYW